MAEYGIGEKPGVRGTTVITASGLYFDFVNPHVDQIVIGDICYGLANTCRFGGQVRDFYSVAQHSILVSSIVPKEHAFAALMHDAAEAYIGDVVGPLKQLLPDYKAIEKHVEKVVCERFGLTLDQINHPEIKRADLRVLNTEKRDVTCGANHNWNGLDKYEPIEDPIVPMDCVEAASRFMATFLELAPEDFWI